MFEKEVTELCCSTCKAEVTCKEKCECWNFARKSAELGYKDGFEKGAEFVYNKANEWHRVSDKLPEMDVFVYLWKEGEDFPVVACRHVPYGKKEWLWDCKWGSGYEISQSKAKDYFWKEIVLPKGDLK